MRHQIRGRRRRSRPCCDAAITVDGQILGSMPSDTSREALAKPSLLTVEIMKSSLNTTKKSTTARRSSPTPPWLLLGLFRNRRCFEYRKERSHRGLREDVKGIFRSVSSQNVVWGLSVDGLKECHRPLYHNGNLPCSGCDTDCSPYSRNIFSRTLPHPVPSSTARRGTFLRLLRPSPFSQAAMPRKGCRLVSGANADNDGVL
jgi:hypothetical protein